MGTTQDREQRWAKWMAQAQDGDEQAYRLLLEEISVAIKSFLVKRLKAESAVFDVMQDSLMAIHRSRHTFNPSRPFGPWMYAIVRNRMNDFFRKSIRIAKRETSNEELVHSFRVPQAQDEHPMLDEVKAALEELPEKQREVIEMLKLQSLSVKEVSEKLGMSQSAVKVTAHRGYIALRKRFGV